MSSIGENFFETRARLGTAIYALTKLATDLEMPPARVQLLNGLLANLREPFLFVVAGEVNAGKSTLLNALFGKPFCETNALPMTDKICLFKYGPESHDITVSDSLVELYRPEAFLKDFNIVDTPGTNSIMENHQEITERFIPMADLVIFTFSVTNPWGGTAWALLDRIHKSWFKNIIFALQQCDLRSREEISAIVEHIRVTSQQRLGAQFPTFAVSGKQAFLSKTSGVDKERLWEESGFEGLEQYINAIVNSPEVQEKKLGNVSRSARLVLTEARENLAAATRILQADEQLLSGLGHHVDAQKRRTLEKFSSFYRTLDSTYMELSFTATNYVRRQLGPVPGPGRLFGKDDTAEVLEKRLQEGMEDAADNHIDNAIAIVEDDLQHLWRYMQDKMRDHYNFNIKVQTPSGEPDWSQQKHHMRGRLMATLDRKLPNLKLDEQLSKPIRKRAWSLATMYTMACLALAGGASAYFLKLVPASDLTLVGGIAGGVALLFVIIASTYAQKSMNKLLRTLGEHFEDQRAQLGRSIEASITEEVDGFFNDFLSLFGPLHNLCAHNRRTYMPKIQELDDLEKAFNEIDRIIRSDGSPPTPATSPSPRINQNISA